MHFRQKLTFMVLGSILTLAGYLLATLAGDVTAQPETETKNATFDRITCQYLNVVDKEGISIVTIGPSLWNGGLIFVKDASGKPAIAIAKLSAFNQTSMELKPTSQLLNRSHARTC